MPSFWQGQIFAPAISAFPTSLWIMPEPRHREVKLRVSHVFTGCVDSIVPGLALGKKQADRQTF